MKAERKVVYNAKVARELLRRGYTIVDIKPDKYDECHKASIFVFKNERTLEAEIFEISEKYNEDKTNVNPYMYTKDSSSSIDYAKVKQRDYQTYMANKNIKESIIDKEICSTAK